MCIISIVLYSFNNSWPEGDKIIKQSEKKSLVARKIRVLPGSTTVALKEKHQSKLTEVNREVVKIM